MYQNNETFQDIHTPEKTAKIMDYSKLVRNVQLSAARLLDIPGAIEAESFSEVLASHPEEEQEWLIARVGAQFDESLIDLVVGSLMNRRNQQVTILAEATEGINGGLPWQPKLEQRISMLRERGYLRTVELQIERYATDDTAIEILTEEARLLAA